MIHKKKKSLLDHLVKTSNFDHATVHHTHKQRGPTSSAHPHKQTTESSKVAPSGHRIHPLRQPFASRLFGEAQEKKVDVKFVKKIEEPEVVSRVEEKNDTLLEVAQPKKNLQVKSVTLPAAPELILEKTLESGELTPKVSVPIIKPVKIGNTTLEDEERINEKNKNLSLEKENPVVHVHVRDVSDEESSAQDAPDLAGDDPEINTLAVPPAQRFHLGFGKTLGNIRELYEYLKEITDSEWPRFVTSDENYFALWVDGVFGENELGKKLRISNNRQESITILDDFLKGQI